MRSRVFCVLVLSAMVLGRADGRAARQATPIVPAPAAALERASANSVQFSRPSPPPGGSCARGSLMPIHEPRSFRIVLRQIGASGWPRLITPAPISIRISS